MKIMRVRQQDGTLVDIPIGIDTSSSALSSHNISTSAHPDIRKNISDRIDGLLTDETFVNNIADEVKQRVPLIKTAEQPIFVDSIEQMTDPDKIYMLSTDGMLYSYQKKTIITPGGTTPNFINRVPISEDTAPNSIFNGSGYIENKRLSSSGDISSNPQDGSVTTGFIPFHNGDKTVIRMKGVEWENSSTLHGGHHYIIFYNGNKKVVDTSNHLIEAPADGIRHILTITRDADGIETITFNQTYGSSNALLDHIRNDAKWIRITAYGKGDDFIVTTDEEITYTTTEGGEETIYSWESTGISYNQPADYEDRVITVETDVKRLKNQTATLTNRVNNLEEGGGATGGGDYESYYNVQMNKLYTDNVVKENAALNSALETLCNRRDGSTQSRQVINLKNSGKQKLILHLHKRANDGYDTVNDAYLPNAQNDFSDVRITTDSGETLKYQTVYCGNIDVISDSRLGNSDVSFLADGAGNIYIQKQGYVVKSTDAGKTWTKITSINTQLSPSLVNQLSYVCEDGTLFFVAKDYSLLYKSAPPYSSIKQVLDVSEGGTYTGNAIRPFQFVQLPTGEMLIGSYQSEFAIRIWKSTDNGDNWTKVFTNTDERFQHIHRMTVDPYQNPVAIYAGMDRGWGYKTLDPDTGKHYNESGGLLRSTDGGETWINLYDDQRGKPSTVDHGVTYVDPSGYRLLGGETGICGGHSIIRTTDDINFVPVLSADHAVYGPEKLNGYIIAGGCGSNGGKNAVIFMSDDEGLTWKQIYSEEPTISNKIASAGIKTFLKGTFAGTDYEQLIGHNMITEVNRPSKRIISNDSSWYAEIIVDVPDGTNSIIVESGYMCPNLSVINNDTENFGEAVFVMDFNENGKYLKEKVSGEIYKGDHAFRNGGKHLGYIYPDVKSAIDMNAIKLNSPTFDMGIQKQLNLNASDSLTISFWVVYTVNSGFEIIRNGSDVLTFDGVNVRCNNYNLGAIMSVEGGRFAKVDVVIDGANNTIKTYKNGICMYTTSESPKLNLVTSLLTGEKEYTLLKRLSDDDDVTAIQHFEIRHGAPTDKEVYDTYFSKLTDNY